MTREEYSEAYLSGYDCTVRLLLSRGANGDHAREVSQAAWAKGWEYLHQLRQATMVVPWVNTIALNIFRNLTRHPWTQLPPEITLPQAPGFSPLDVAGVVVSRVLELCNPRERLLFEQQMAGMTTHEMAVAHGATETAIRIRLLRARRAVKERLETRAADFRRAYSEPEMPPERAMAASASAGSPN
jgi:DNA-directed RNA polymerase specialized sigma24 family protein